MTIAQEEGSAREDVPSGIPDSPLLWAGRITGSGLLVWMGWIHLHLWSEGYKHLRTIGPLLMADFVAAIVIALLVLGVHRRNFVAAAVLAGAVLALATLGALALSINVGLFGFTESWKAPFTHVGVGIESAAAVVLLATAAWAGSSGRQAGAGSSGRQAGPTGRQPRPTGRRRD